MSEQGWQDFLAAADLNDWAVLHGGATAVFRTASLADAASLAVAISALPATETLAPLLTLSHSGVSVRLTRDVWHMEGKHIDLARSISEVARQHRAQADRSAIQEVQLAIAAQPDMIDVAFWRAVLGYAPAADDNAIDPLGHGSTIWMQELDPAKPLRHAMHIDVSVPRECAEARIMAAIAAGGRIADDSHAPSHWTLADRAGNKVCIAAWPDGSSSQG